jgi:hypothetical protein
VRATSVLLRQIRNPILILLLIAALVSGLTKTRFYRAPHARTPRPASTHAERLERRIRRRASRFIHHPARGPAPGRRSPRPHRQGP